MGKTKISVHLHMPVNTVPELMAALKALQKREVVAGFPEDKNKPRQNPDGSAVKGPLNNATIGFILDKGSPAAHIPPRPFLEPGIEAGKTAIVDELRETGAAALHGDASAIEAGLTRTGLVAVSAIRNKITSGPFRKLSERTLDARRRRGVKRTNPLIDTGQLNNAVNFTVRNKKG